MFFGQNQPLLMCGCLEFLCTKNYDLSLKLGRLFGMKVTLPIKCFSAIAHTIFKTSPQTRHLIEYPKEYFLNCRRTFTIRRHLGFDPASQLDTLVVESRHFGIRHAIFAILNIWIFLVLEFFWVIIIAEI